MTARAEWKPERRPVSFSFYLTAHACNTNPELAKSAAELADAITIAGPKGPETARRLRDAGLEVPFLFDGTGYRVENVPGPEKWIQQQAHVGAARLLLPGAFVRWDKDSDTALELTVREQGRIAEDLGAMILLALDVRWVAKRTKSVVDALQSTGQPVALVLAHRADPLSEGGAVEGMQRVASSIDPLFQLRSDHGGFGTVVFGAEHASIGLTTTTRHFATAMMRPRRRPGSSARLFVRPLFDWFLASDIAGWTAAGSDINCPLACCRGASLSRFLDPDLDSKWHNMNALADYGDYILNAEPADQIALFRATCRDAVLLYGLAGFQGPENPKAQLTSWALL